MLQLYNAVGMYPGLQVPTPEVLELGVKLHTSEDYIREKLLPHLGFNPVKPLRACLKLWRQWSMSFGFVFGIMQVPGQLLLLLLVG